MKIIIIVTIIISIVAISFTAMMIKVKNENNNEIVNNASNISNLNNTENENSNNENNTQLTSFKQEKSLASLGTYDENDLIIDKIGFKVAGVAEVLSIPQISGLKNKEIENKINEDIKNRIIEKGKELVKNIDNIEVDFYFGEYYLANYSNIISLQCYFYNKNDWEILDFCNLNYELINGNRLKLDDIFADGTDLKTILRTILYRYNVSYEFNHTGGFSQEYDELSYFDYKDNVWVYNHVVEDYENDTQETKTLDYVPELTDYEIEKLINKFLASDRENFCFNNRFLNVDFENNISHYIFSKDYSDKLVIYDKYLTKESIFEKDNIGKKGVLKYSTVNIQPTFYSDNLIYDISYLKEDSDDYYERVEKISDQEKYANICNKNIDKVLEEYKEKANNKEKAYYIFMKPYIEFVRKKWDSAPLNAIYCCDNLTIISCDIKDKDKMYNSVLGNYLYINASMHLGRPKAEFVRFYR